MVGGPQPHEAAQVHPGFVAPRGDTAARLQQLAHTTARLAAAETIEEITEVVVTDAHEAMGAAVSTLMLREGDQVVLVGTHGTRPGVDIEFASFGLDDRNPASEAAREGRPVLLSAAERIEQKYPVLAGHMPPGRSLVCLPLRAGAEPLGSIGLTFDDNWLPGPVELDFLIMFADTCAQAIRRTRATFETEEKARQLQFLADASAELAGNLDYRATLSNVARLAVPTLADWCAVDVLQGEQLVTFAVAHVDPAKVEWAWQLQERYPTDPDAPAGAPNVVRTGVSELYPQITDEMLVAGARDQEHLRISRELDLGSAIVVPLSARGRVLGAITLLRTKQTPPYGPAELSVAEDLGRRAAVAIDNAILHGQTEDVALQLQRAVLPEDLAKLTGWHIATYYRPGGQAEVGGDFYDAVALDDDRLVIYIGDVMGHGVAAAAAMAQMRASIRAYLCIDESPARVIEKLDAMYERLGVQGLATLSYVLIDTPARELHVVNAGHYPPLVVAADGTVEFARPPTQRPFGVGGDHRVDWISRFEGGDTLLLYTDGVVERRVESIDQGLARLASAASLLSGDGLQDALDRLVDELRDEALDDDVTAVAVRLR